MQATPLDGFTVGITADRRADEQAQLLVRRGAKVVHGPSIRTVPMDDEAALRSVTYLLIDEPPDILLANTGIGMRTWFSAADSWGIGEALTGALAEAAIFARGPKASGAVHQQGLHVVARAASERMEEAVELVLASQDVNGRRVAFQRHGDDANEALKRLIDAGASIIEVPVYRWRMPVDARPAVKLVEQAISGGLQAVTFTSAPALRNLFLIAEEADLADPLREALNGWALPVCVGPVCAAAATEEGIGDPVMPDKYRLGPMLRELTDALIATVRVHELQGRTMARRGSVLEIEGRRVELSDRELGVLVELLASPRSLTKAELLARVWRGTVDDEHVVEVTVGRLRRKLGPCAGALIAIPRRGYRLEATAITTAVHAS